MDELRTESRNAARLRSLLGAKIIINDRRSLFDCVIKNISSSGAQLLVESSIGIPDEFRLELNDGSRPSQACRVMWRKAKLLGVAFI